MMNSKAQHIATMRRAATRLAAILCCALSLTACDGVYYSQMNEIEELADNAELYLQLHLTLAESYPTRAVGTADTPWGGDTGNGTEEGKQNESMVHDAMLLFYTKSLNDETLGDDDKVELAVYFSEFKYDATIDQWVATVSLNASEADAVKDKTLRVLTVTNAGDMTATFKDMKLTQLRDYQYTGAIFSIDEGKAAKANLAGTRMAQYMPQSTADYSRFVMTSKDELVFPFSATISKAMLPPITVQRLAARVELGFDSSLFSATTDYPLSATARTKGVKFPVYLLDPETHEPQVQSGHYVESGEYFLLTDITLSSSYVGGTYLVKRTADNTSGGNTRYFGTESTFTGGAAASNYVLSPNNTSAGNYYDFEYSVGSDICSKTPIYTLGERAYYALAYTRENTNKSALYTGLTLSGYYNTTGTVVSGQPNDFSHANKREYSFLLRHSDPDGNGTERDPMHYGVVRNNIYRVYIENIFTDQKYVYVRWYHYRNNGKDEVDYEDVAFNAVVQTVDNNKDTYGYPDD